MQIVRTALPPSPLSSSHPPTSLLPPTPPAASGALSRWSFLLWLSLGGIDVERVTLSLSSARLPQGEALVAL